tara:strand:- start:426 stop:1067 length:642 start_codon:yes stop_codon:yes gene_type:complete
MKIEWNKYDSLLGNKSDNKLAEEIGCSPTAVKLRRRKLSISPAIHSVWTKDDDELLKDGLIKCVKCDLTKPTDCFYKLKSKTRTGRHKTCKDCHTLRKKQKWRALKEKYLNALGAYCHNCGHDEFIASLQFHHVQEKDMNISQIVYSESGKVHEELKKCCVLCANCHSAFHANEIELKFKKQDIGWTVSNPRRLAHLQNCPTEDKGLTNELSD